MHRLPLLFVLLLASGAVADQIVLKDGTRLSGDVKRNADGWTITMADGAVRTVAPDSVKSIELGAAPKGAQQAAEGLASLRRSVEALSDINQIIDRYQRFIESSKDAKVAADAQADLEMWRQRRDKGLVKHGSKWVAPEEVAALAAKATALAEEARDLIRQNRNKEAEPVLQQALDIDPANPSALYLRGVMLYRQDKFPDARKAFEAVNSALPGHAPTLNNLGVVLGRQNQQPAALNYFDQAMQAQPVNKYILNNVAEALGTIPEEQRKGAAIAKCLHRFAEQDLILQQQMAQQGLYRWGGTWVDQKKLDELKAAEKEVRDKIEAMQAEFDQTKAKISQIDQQVADNERMMEEMRARSVYSYVDKDGQRQITYLPLPQAYYDTQRQNQRLRSEQDSLKAKLSGMQKQAERVRQQVPIPQFTGIQQIVGVEGMPGPQDVLPPATAPATTRASTLK